MTEINYFNWLWYILLLLGTSNACSAFNSEDDEFYSVLVTQSDDVILHLQETLLQFQFGNITDGGIIHQVNISRNQMWDQSIQAYHHKPTVFQPFVSKETEYVLLCHFAGCSIYNTSDIRINNRLKESLLKDTNNAQLVIYKSSYDALTFFSAVTDSAGISTISLSWFDPTSISLDLESSFKSKEYQHFNFVYSFSVGVNIYFIRNVEDIGGNRAMISQLCGKDIEFRSYIESNLNCNTYSSVLSATIINNSFLALAMGKNDKTALCVFDIQRIEAHFKQALTSCFKEANGSWPAWINETGDSCTTRLSNTVYECGYTAYNWRILSSQSLTTSNITKLDVDGHVANQSMVFKDYNGTVYGYIGFRTGHIWKVIFDEPSRMISQLSHAFVSNTPIRQLVFNNNGSSLFFITAKTLERIAVDPTCPPTIGEVGPMNGTLDGGTTLTLTGTFSITNFKDAFSSTFRSSVSIVIGNTPCRNISVESSRNRITCVTPEQHSAGNMTIKVEIRISSSIRCSGSTEHDYMFAYMEPLLDNSPTIETQRIKLSGCVPISVHGNNLDIGTTRQMLVGDSTCNITSFNRSMVTCLAPKQPSLGYYQVTLRVDNTNLTGPLVTYIPEPNITSIDPQYTTTSGGITLTITGENLEGLGTDLYLHIAEFSTNICKTYGNLTSFTIECVTPEIGSTSKEQPFLRDDNCLDVPIDIPISIIPDPVMEEADRTINDETKPLFFKGNDLTYIRNHDVTISVGAAQCLEVEVVNEGISCTLTRESILERQLKEKVMCRIGFRTYYLGTIALVEIPDVREHRKTNDDTNYSGVIIGTLFAAVCIVCVAIYISRRIRRKKRQERYSAYYSHNGPVLSLDGLSESHVSETLQGRPNDYMASRYLRADNTNVKEQMQWTPIITQDVRNLLDDKKLLISKDCLVLGEIVGQGHFGCVYKGYLQLNSEKTEHIVACKTLHRNNPEELDVDAFLREAIVMKDFHHKNVMELLGICLGINTLPLVILPFMKMGDALSYIRDIRNIPTVKQLVVFGVDVANGMDYLSQLKFVHRDLAARNCMIADDMTVKVADFGLSRDVYEKEYYTSCDKKAKLPVKWMSPESLEFGIYTTKSDVWSFGVLMWEFLTRGVNPYPTVDGWDILRYLKTGRRLNRPEFCPDEMYRILQSCWEWEADNRPTFGDLTTSIPALLRILQRASEKRKISSRFEDKDETEHIGVIGGITSSHDIPKVESISETEESVEMKTPAGKEETEEINSREDYAIDGKNNPYINKDIIKVN